MELTYIYRALMRRKWIILICTVVAVGVAFLLVMNSKRQYRSSAQLSTGFTVSDEIRLSNESFSLPQIELKFNNAVENITSSKVISLVSYNLMLHDLKSEQPFTRLTDDQKKKPEYTAVKPERVIQLLQTSLDSGRVITPSTNEGKAVMDFLELYEYDVYSLNQKLQVGRYQRTDYINIVFRSHNPNLSAFVVNTVCNEFKRFYGINKRERAGGSITNLDSVLRARKAILDQKISEKNSFMSDQGVVDVSIEGSSTLSQISGYESELINTRSLEQDLVYRLNQINTQLRRGGSTGGDDAAPVTGSNSGYLALRKRYNDLNAEYIRKGSNDSELKQRMDDVLAEINKIDISETRPGRANNNKQDDGSEDLQNKKTDIEAQLQAARQKIRAIQSKLGQLRGGLTGMASKGANIEQLNKEIEIASSEYSAAKEQLTLAQSMEAVPGTFKQTIIGEPALRPEPSKRLAIMGLAGASGFVLSCLVIIFMEFFDNSIKTPTQFQRLTQLPLLGVINKVKLDDANIASRVAHVGDNEKDRDDLFRELLRKLRYEIASSKKKIILFTSTESNQGKTTLIQALAYSMSWGKKRVLIIDTNFCNNDLTVANKATPVLESFELNGKPFDVSDMDQLVTPSSVSGVDIIGCEGGDYTPSEILPKNHLLNYLDQLKDVYDYIFLEGAPLNGFTDAKELANYSEGIIVVFSAETSISAADKESLTFFEQHKNKFIGAILNKVDNNNLDM